MNSTFENKLMHECYKELRFRSAPGYFKSNIIILINLLDWDQ